MNVASLAFQRGTLMKLPRRAFLHLAAGAAALPAASRVARAQAYPAQPVRVVVPFAPALADLPAGQVKRHVPASTKGL